MTFWDTIIIKLRAQTCNSRGLISRAPDSTIHRLGKLDVTTYFVFVWLALLTSKYSYARTTYEIPRKILCRGYIAVILYVLVEPSLILDIKLTRSRTLLTYITKPMKHMVNRLLPLQ